MFSWIKLKLLRPRPKDTNIPQFLQTNTRCQHLSLHTDQSNQELYQVALENLHIFWRALVKHKKKGWIINQNADEVK